MHEAAGCPFSSAIVRVLAKAAGNSATFAVRIYEVIVAIRR